MMKTPFDWCLDVPGTKGAVVFDDHQRAHTYMRAFRPKWPTGGYQGFVPGVVRFRNGSTLTVLVDSGTGNPLQGYTLDWAVYPVDPSFTFDVAVSPPPSGSQQWRWQWPPRPNPSSPFGPGYTLLGRGSGTFHARTHLARLGCRWDGTGRNWWAPDDLVDEARRLIREGEAGRLSSDTPSSEDVTAVTCWECGERRFLREVVGRGGNATEFYCGCGEQPQIAQGRPAPRATW